MMELAAPRPQQIKSTPMKASSPLLATLPLIVLFAALPSARSAEASDEAALRRFLISVKDTYGWQPVEGDISYDFFPNGNLHIQGPDGEATMWQGKWKLKGSQLTITNSDKKTTKTVVAKIAGNDLLLDGKRYRRYRPQ